MPTFGRTVWFLWHTSDRKWCKQTRRAQTRPSNRCLIARSRFRALPLSCVNCAEMFSKNNDGFAWPAARVTSAPHVFRKLSHCETGWGGRNLDTAVTSPSPEKTRVTKMQHLICCFYSVLKKRNHLYCPVHCRGKQLRFFFLTQCF